MNEDWEQWVMTTNIKESICLASGNICKHLEISKGTSYCRNKKKDEYLLCERNVMSEILKVHIEFCNAKECAFDNDCNVCNNTNCQGFKHYNE